MNESFVSRIAVEIEEIKADKQPIGRYAGEKPFTNHEIELSEGDTIYIFSDGYPDQFGGELGKKYKSAKFKEFLLSIQELDMEQQREALRIEFETWRGSLEQIDDVCIIGVRV
jgi:serine phosphatase RsbU (regulator of sigma subunit)